jgi:hypothetical protein
LRLTRLDTFLPGYATSATGKVCQMRPSHGLTKLIPLGNVTLERSRCVQGSLTPWGERLGTIVGQVSGCTRGLKGVLPHCTKRFSAVVIVTGTPPPVASSDRQEA